MAVSDIFNVIQVTDRTALAGQPSEAELRALPDEGYAVVVNLAPVTKTVRGEEVDEVGILQALGLDYHAIPVSWEAPEAEQYARFAAVMDSIGDQKTLVHCAANYRVTAFYALYAMQRLGWAEAKADALIDSIWNSRPEVRMSDDWKRLIAETKASFPSPG